MDFVLLANNDYFNMVSVDPVSALKFSTTYTPAMTVQVGDNQIHRIWNFTTAVDKTLFPYSISGNAGVDGATINYTGGSTVTDENGDYSIPIASGWSGTVTPTKPGYIFSPPQRNYTDIKGDQLAQNYTAEKIYTISGDTDAAGVALNYTDGTAKSTKSGNDGSYSLPVSNTWSGTVTPLHTCYTFSPPSRGYINMTSNQAGQDYTAIIKAGCSDVNVTIRGEPGGRYGIPAGGRVTPQYPILNGPVNAASTNATSIFTSERVHNATGFVNRSGA